MPSSLLWYQGSLSLLSCSIFCIAANRKLAFYRHLSVRDALHFSYPFFDSSSAVVGRNFRGGGEGRRRREENRKGPHLFFFFWYFGATAPSIDPSLSLYTYISPDTPLLIYLSQLTEASRGEKKRARGRLNRIAYKRSTNKYIVIIVIYERKNKIILLDL